MKTVVTKLFFVFFIFSASLYAQYFIHEDIIREHRNSQNESYFVPPERQEGKKLYLISVGGQNGMKTNVYVGFDKTEYMKGEEVTLTVKRDNDEKFNNSNFNITIYAREEIILMLGQGEQKQVNFNLPAEVDFIYFGIQIRGDNPLNETIEYGMVLEDDPQNPPKEERKEENRIRSIIPKPGQNQQDTIVTKPKPFKLNIKEKK